MHTPLFATIDSQTALDQLLEQQEALLLLFGAPNCGVCQTLKPRIAAMLHKEFPRMQSAYIDCLYLPAVAAAHKVFTLPVVELYFQGKPFARFSRVFSLRDLIDAIERPYSLMD